MLPQHMTYPAALSKDLNVTAGNYKMEPPENVTEHYVRLQEALKQPAGERQESKQHKITSVSFLYIGLTIMFVKCYLNMGSLYIVGMC